MASKNFKFKMRRKFVVKNLLQAAMQSKADDDNSVPFFAKEDAFKDRPTNYVLQ